MLSKNKKMKKKKSVRDPEVFSGFSLRGRRVVELNVLADALDGAVKPVVQLYGSPTALTRQ